MIKLCHCPNKMDPTIRLKSASAPSISPEGGGLHSAIDPKQEINASTKL